MSAIITGRVFWTIFPELQYKNANGKTIRIKTSTAKVVMLAIADSADDFGENSWQSLETIAEKTSLERRSVIRVVRALVLNDLLKVAGVTMYGTNNFSINLKLLGYPPTRRAKNGRPKTSDSEAKTGDSETKTSDSEAKTGDVESPYPLVNPPKPPLTVPGASIDWALGHDQPVTQADLDRAKAIDEAPKMFERAFGFGTLPWGSTKVWEKMRNFITEIYVNDGIAFGEYVIWRASKDGKYTAMSNKQIRMNPQVFIDTGWMEFVNSKSVPSMEKADDVQPAESPEDAALREFAAKELGGKK